MSDAIRAANVARARELIADIQANDADRERKRTGRAAPIVESPTDALARIKAAGPMVLSESARKAFGLPPKPIETREAAE